MNIICTILAGIRCLMERVSEWAGRRKISKKSRRDKAVFVVGADRKSTRLNSSHKHRSRMPSSA